jgi:uncharacterized protein
MNCPVCTNVALVMTDRQGIEIDYCPKCRGVWLDRGELDKLIDRSAGTAPPPPRGDDHSYSDRRPHDSDRDYRGGYRRKKREGFLSDLFDFD